MTRVAAGEGSVSTALTAFSVALRSEASSFFFLHRDAPQSPTQRMKMAITAVSIFGKKFLILEDFFTAFLKKFHKNASNVRLNCIFRPFSTRLFSIRNVEKNKSAFYGLFLTPLA